MSKSEKISSTQSAEYYQFERTEMVEFLPAQYEKVLEIGCARGGFKNLLDDGCEYWGVEFDSHSAAIAEPKLHKVLVGDYMSVERQLPDEYFDLVVCNDVIEHMIDERKFLCAIKSKMTPQGTIVISLPNVRYVKNLYELLIRKDWRYADSGILDRTHLRFFTSKSIKRTVRESGFKINQMHGINNAIRSESVLKRITQYLIYLPATLIFGRDILFMQFALSCTNDTADKNS